MLGHSVLCDDMRCRTVYTNFDFEGRAYPNASLSVAGGAL